MIFLKPFEKAGIDYLNAAWNIRGMGGSADTVTVMVTVFQSIEDAQALAAPLAYRVYSFPKTEFDKHKDGIGSRNHAGFRVLKTLPEFFDAIDA